MKHAAPVAIALQGLDWHSTTLGLASGATEANPIMAALIHEYGAVGHGVVKIAGACALVGLGWLGWRLQPHPATALMWFLNGVMAYVVATNYAVLW